MLHFLPTAQQPRQICSFVDRWNYAMQVGKQNTRLTHYITSDTHSSDQLKFSDFASGTGNHSLLQQLIFSS